MDVGSVIAAGLMTATAALSVWLVSRTLWRISRPLAAAAGSGLLVSWLGALEVIVRPLSSQSGVGVAGAPIVFLQFAFLVTVALAIVWAPVLLIGLAARGKVLRSVAAAWAGVLWAGFLATSLVYPVWRVTRICLPPGGLVEYLGSKVDLRLVQECEIAKLSGLLWVLALVVLYLIALSMLAWRYFPDMRARLRPHHYRAP